MTGPMGTLVWTTRDSLLLSSREAHLLKVHETLPTKEAPPAFCPSSLLHEGL